jgi:hypothetical protein
MMLNPLKSTSDADITCLDTTTLETFDLKVKPFFIMIVFDKFDELMLRHDVFSLLFSEIYTWIKKSVKQKWKACRTKVVYWGPIPYIPVTPWVSKKLNKDP